MKHVDKESPQYHVTNLKRKSEKETKPGLTFLSQ